MFFMKRRKQFCQPCWVFFKKIPKKCRWESEKKLSWRCFSKNFSSKSTTSPAHVLCKLKNVVDNFLQKVERIQWNVHIFKRIFLSVFLGTHRMWSWVSTNLAICIHQYSENFSLKSEKSKKKFRKKTSKYSFGYVERVFDNPADFFDKGLRFFLLDFQKFIWDEYMFPKNKENPKKIV